MSAAREAVKAITTFAEFHCYLSEAAENLGHRPVADELMWRASVADAAARQIALVSGEPALAALWGPRVT